MTRKWQSKNKSSRNFDNIFNSFRYVVVDNLRYLLYPYSPSYPLFFGYRFKPYTKQGYMAGMSIILSKQSLTRFMNDPDPQSPCNFDGEGADDVQIGLCADAVNVLSVDGRDDVKGERFLPMEPEFFIAKDGLEAAPWLKDYAYYNIAEVRHYQPLVIRLAHANCEPLRSQFAKKNHMTEI